MWDKYRTFVFNIFRSASSPASMVVSWFARNRVPKFTSAIGSVLISMGVALAMYGGATIVDDKERNFIFWCIGVTILLSTLFTGAFTGLQQEILYSKYGKHPSEVCIILINLYNLLYFLLIVIF